MVSGSAYMSTKYKVRICNVQTDQQLDLRAATWFKLGQGKQNTLSLEHSTGKQVNW